MLHDVLAFIWIALFLVIWPLLVLLIAEEWRNLRAEKNK